MTTKQPMRVAVTGAAGQICYNLLFRIARGDLLGDDVPIVLHLIEIPQAIEATRGVVMELEDCAFPLLRDVVVTADLDEGFGDVDVAVLVGAKPRGPGMERADLLQDNGKIFVAQGEAIDRSASADVRVLVVGNPCNTNVLIAASRARRTDPRNYAAMTRLDQNRATAQLASKAGVPVTEVRNVAVWGNHSPTMFPDWFHATIGGRPAEEVIGNSEWLRGEFLETVRKRGAAIIKARGKSSAASAANAALDCVREWFTGQMANDWASLAVRSNGEYGVPEGLYFSMPVRHAGNWHYEVVTDIEHGDFARAAIERTAAELVAERDAIRHLLNT